MSGARRTDGEPHDRLTRLCDAMAHTLEAHPEHHHDDKAIIFIDDDKRGGIVLHGYDDDADAMMNLFVHLQAIFEANGSKLIIAPLEGNPGTN